MLEEINVKSMEFDDDESAYFGYRAEPDFKKIGPRLGGKVGEAIKALAVDRIKELVRTGKIEIEIDSMKIPINGDEVKIKLEPKEGYTVMADGGITVALDLALDEELLAEGNARELVNKIQNLRKSAGLEVTDRIDLGISDNEESKKALSSFGDYIKLETLADKLSPDTNLSNSVEFSLNGVKTVVALEKSK